MPRFLIAALLTLATATLPAIADADAPDIPDLSEFDRDTLQTVAEQLYARVAALEEEVAELREQLAAAEAGDTGDNGGDGEDAAWRVTILSNKPADISALKRQLVTEQAKLASDSALTRRLMDAQKRLADMEAARDTYWDSKGRRKSRARYSNSDLLEPKRQARSLEREKRSVEASIRRIEREIQQAESMRRISAQLEDGRGVTIIAGGVFLQLGKSLEEGKDYMVTGRGSVSGSVPMVHLRSAAEVSEN